MTLSRRVQSLAGSWGFRTGLHRRILRERAVIALFHRVADGVPDNYLTCPPQLFRRYCAFFRRYFDVVPLARILGRLEEGADLTGRLAITFDDGYRDNFTVAAPILREFDLPATFFVTAGFIGTSASAPWDAARGIEAEWMSWDEVAALAEDGFTIGGHTMTHADLGRTEGKAATEEIVGSKRLLEEKLSRRIDQFSYPFGGPDRMTEANRSRVEAGGFSCCLSAEGGLVGPDSDPYRLSRMAITAWHLSPEQWGFDLLRARITESPTPADESRSSPEAERRVGSHVSRLPSG